MSVFTRVSRDELAAWLKSYSLGPLLDLQGISAGIENTNYFVTAGHTRYVLTLFEKLTRDELPFFLGLLDHLASHGTPCPRPVANLENHFLGELNGKPACLVSCLEGQPLDQPDPAHCAQMGEMLADLHLAGRTYPAQISNPRGPGWWQKTAPQVLPKMPATEAELLSQEIAWQSGFRFEDLPRGIIHGDLFRDNVLFKDGALNGVIDFYYACNDALLYDLAIAANDWCMTEDRALDRERVAAMVQAYHLTRPFSASELAAWPIMLRAAALRFWLSRLGDFYFPRPGELTHAKDPSHFRDILQQHIAAPSDLRQLL
ncbi:MAG: homoserine kinase [Betaproteobacteria bacterium]|nr:homoserine kinase [Betaproteobacteria bacterium]